MKGRQHKTTPKVRNGQVQKKDRHEETTNYWNTYQRIPVFDKEKPGPGYKHYLRKNHLVRFIQMLPDWDELSTDLDAVVLAEGVRFEDGRCFSAGVIYIRAWPRDPHISVYAQYFHEHSDIFERLGVSSSKAGNHYICRFTEEQVRAYQLLHIFLHELGHHHDRDSDIGEKYAEQYARNYEAQIWTQYINEFGL